MLVVPKETQAGELVEPLCARGLWPSWMTQRRRYTVRSVTLEVVDMGGTRRLPGRRWGARRNGLAGCDFVMSIFRFRSRVERGGSKGYLCIA
jgi:hypothetical protein